LESQLELWRRKLPNSDIKGEVLDYFPSISTRDVKKVETNYVQRFKDNTGKLPKGNQNHPGIK